MNDDAAFLEELAKSLEDEDQREAVAKALEAVSKAEERATEAEEIAKAERDLRLEREFISKAAEFSLPVPPAELGPVLKRAAENLEREDFDTIVKCLYAASAEGDLYSEIGKRGGGDNADIFDEVEVRAQEIMKSAENVSKEAATAAVFEMNPGAYDQYMKSHPARRI
jgi:hypothetical protein